MLKDNEIDNLIQPFVERQEKLNEYVIGKIAQRVKQVGSLSKSDVYKLSQLLKVGADARSINQEIASVLRVQEQNVKSMIRLASIKTYTDAKPFYDYRHITQIPYERNTRLQRTVNAISKVTEGTFKNLSNSKAIGFTIRDMKNPSIFKFQNVTQTYQSVIDEAVQAVHTGTMDFDTAMRRTLRQLNDSGLRTVHWESGYSRRLDSTVRMNILGGLRQLNQQIQQQIAEEIKADGIELSAHSFSAPDHEPVQGRIFTLKQFDRMQNEMDFEDIDGKHYTSIRRPIGEWNCRHFTQAIIIAKHKPTWTSKDLDELKEQNAEGYTDRNGKHYTMYECTQVMRDYELKIRKSKEGYMMAKQADNEKLADEYKVKIAQYQAEYRQFSKDCGITRQNKRTFVPNYSNF